jgi:hypothetical protein
MEIQSIVLLIVSIILVIFSAWNLSVFIRLSGLIPQYTITNELETACHVSEKYVSRGKKLSIIMLVLSIILLIVSSIVIVV